VALKYCGCDLSWKFEAKDENPNQRQQEHKKLHLITFKKKITSVKRHDVASFSKSPSVPSI
jgi:hypothetical protein